MTPEQGKTATGGVFGFLKQHLSEENYSKVSQQFPEADSLLATEQQQQQQKDGGSGGSGSAGGLMGAAMGALSSSSQGGGSNGDAGMDLAKLMTMLGSKGISPTQLQSFLPMAAPYIQKMTGVNVTSLMGAGSAAGGGSGGSGGDPLSGMLNSLTGGGGGGSSSGGSGGGENPMGQMMGMFGK